MDNKERNHTVLLQAQGVAKSFYQPMEIEILKHIDLEVHRGDTVAIMGRSGEGKSTLLQLLGTLDFPCSGSLKIMDMQVGRFNAAFLRNQHLGFIFQSFHLLEDYSVLDNVLMPAKIARKACHKSSQAYERACELLEVVGLSDRVAFNTKLLSGGEKQRAAIARALCNDPDLILADEPSGNLDKKTAHIIHELLLTNVQKSKKALIVVTHDEELAKLCSKRLVLESGVLKTG